MKKYSVCSFRRAGLPFCSQVLSMRLVLPMMCFSLIGGTLDLGHLGRRHL